MKKNLLLVFVWTITLSAQEGRLIPNPIRNIPRWVRAEYTAQGLDARYVILFKLYPNYLRGDFNGDGKRDAVIQVQEEESGKVGLMIFHSKQNPQMLRNPITVLGAGKSMSSAGDDLKWMDMWSLLTRRGVSALEPGAKLPPFKGDALRIEKRGERGGVIYWDGKKYVWHQLPKPRVSQPKK